MAVFDLSLASTIIETTMLNWNQWQSCKGMEGGTAVKWKYSEVRIPSCYANHTILQSVYFSFVKSMCFPCPEVCKILICSCSNCRQFKYVVVFSINSLAQFFGSTVYNYQTNNCSIIKFDLSLITKQFN